MKIVLQHRPIFLLLAFLLVFALGFYIWPKGIPFVGTRSVWSIGILVGSSPFDMTSPEIINNPILTAADVTDVQAEFVADPFMIVNESYFYMYFEVFNGDTKHGDIGLAMSKDGLSWTYKQIVIDEPFHLSYPYVFSWERQYYMIPESNRDLSVRLYKANKFPTNWEFVGRLLTGYNFIDPSILRFNDQWWLFFSSTSNDILRLYHANDLMGPWIEHPKSPLIERNPNIARPGGRVLLINGKLFRFAQDDNPRYGLAVNAFEITDLSPTSYEELPYTENPIISASGTGWNGMGMHHFDPHYLGKGKWLASVDGIGTRMIFGRKY